MLLLLEVLGCGMVEILLNLFICLINGRLANRSSAENENDPHFSTTVKAFEFIYFYLHDHQALSAWLFMIGQQLILIAWPIFAIFFCSIILNGCLFTWRGRGLGSPHLFFSLFWRALGPPFMLILDATLHTSQLYKGGYHCDGVGTAQQVLWGNKIFYTVCLLLLLCQSGSVSLKIILPSPPKK